MSQSWEIRDNIGEHQRVPASEGGPHLMLKIISDTNLNLDIFNKGAHYFFSSPLVSGINLHSAISISPTLLGTTIRCGRPTKKPTPTVPFT